MDTWRQMEERKILVPLPCSLLSLQMIIVFSCVSLAREKKETDIFTLLSYFLVVFLSFSLEFSSSFSHLMRIRWNLRMHGAALYGTAMSVEILVKNCAEFLARLTLSSLSLLLFWTKNTPIYRGFNATARVS